MHFTKLYWISIFLNSGPGTGISPLCGAQQRRYFHVSRTEPALILNIELWIKSGKNSNIECNALTSESFAVMYWIC